MSNLCNYIYLFDYFILIMISIYFISYTIIFWKITITLSLQKKNRYGDTKYYYRRMNYYDIKLVNLWLEKGDLLDY
jgi:hypothetical protein